MVAGEALGVIAETSQEVQSFNSGHGGEEGCMGLKAQRDRKQLSFSWQKAKDVLQQNSWDAPEQDLSGKGTRKKEMHCFTQAAFQILLR